MYSVLDEKNKIVKCWIKIEFLLNTNVKVSLKKKKKIYKKENNKFIEPRKNILELR